MGVVGAALVGLWAKNLMRDTAKVLLDREMDAPVVDEIREAIHAGNENGDAMIVDLHVWRVGKQHYSCAMSVITQDKSLTTSKLRERIAIHDEVVHATIEVIHR